MVLYREGWGSLADLYWALRGFPGWPSKSFPHRDRAKQDATCNDHVKPAPAASSAGTPLSGQQIAAHSTRNMARSRTARPVPSAAAA